MLKKQLHSFENKIKTFGNILILSSGYSLFSYKKIIKKIQDKVLIAALPSSISFLEKSQIKYDFIISCDGGFWAKEHLYHSKSKPIIFTCLQSSLPIDIDFEKKIIISFANYFEKFLFSDGSYLLKTEEKASVFFLALEIFKKIHLGNIFILGQDFSIFDINSHVKGHSSEERAFSNTNRLEPVYSQKYKYFVNAKVKSINDKYHMTLALESYYKHFIKKEKEEENIFFVNDFKEEELVLPFKRLCQKEFESFIKERSDKYNSYTKVEALKESRFKIDKDVFFEKIKKLELIAMDKSFLDRENQSFDVLFFKELFLKEISLFLKRGDEKEFEKKVLNFLKKSYDLNCSLQE